jgi:thiol:disulfide interchange protein DsbD
MKFAGLAVVLSFTACGFAALPDGKDLVKAELLADVSAIQPGQPFHVGVLLKIKPQWHVYWKNPGESGVATILDLKLPEGFKASPVQYPVPRQHEDPGGIKFNGYDDEVMLIQQITPPTNLNPGTSVKIQGKSTWLVCAKTCIPGSAELSLEFSVADRSAPANADQFSKWLERLPKESGLAVKHPAPGKIEVTFDQEPRDVEWFFDGGENVTVTDVKANTSGKTSTAQFRIEPVGNKQPDDVEVVVGYTNNDGKRVGNVFRHPIKSLGVNR